MMLRNAAMRLPRYRLRTILIAVAIAGLTFKVVFDWCRLDPAQQLIWFSLSPMILIVAGAMVAMWINWRAPH
jgi:hypothetical protein